MSTTGTSLLRTTLSEPSAPLSVQVTTLSRESRFYGMEAPRPLFPSFASSFEEYNKSRSRAVPSSSPSARSREALHTGTATDAHQKAAVSPKQILTLLGISFQRQSWVNACICKEMRKEEPETSSK